MSIGLRVTNREVRFHGRRHGSLDVAGRHRPTVLHSSRGCSDSRRRVRGGWGRGV